MTGAADIEDVDAVLLDDAIQMHVDEVQSRSGAPVTEKPGLHVLGLQRLAQQGIVHQIDLADRYVVGSAPVEVNQSQLRIIQGRHLELRCGNT